MSQAHKKVELTIELVPSPLWFVNLRTSMPRSSWDNLRKSVYQAYGLRCGVCNKSNVQLHCHEIWDYDDENHIQTLEGFIALCEMCHHCKHLGLAGILASKGKLDMDAVIAHFTQVNNCSREEYEQKRAQAFSLWRERSQCQWVCDITKYAHLLSSESIFKEGRYDTRRKRT